MKNRIILKDITFLTILRPGFWERCTCFAKAQKRTKNTIRSGKYMVDRFFLVRIPAQNSQFCGKIGMCKSTEQGTTCEK